MPKYNSGKHGYGRRYIMDAILDAMPDNRWICSEDLVEAVSDISGKEVSAQRIGGHMSMLEGEGSVSRRPPRRCIMWRKT